MAVAFYYPSKAHPRAESRDYSTVPALAKLLELGSERSVSGKMMSKPIICGRFVSIAR